MPLEPTSTNQFDRIAPLYDILSYLVFGRSLQRAQTVFLADIPTGATILLVGGGSGWLLEQIIRTCQPRRVLYLELSAQMVARASQRMIKKGLLGTVEFQTGSILELQSPESFDVILTPFLLDLFTPDTLQNKVIPRLLANLNATGLWLATDFIPTDVGWQKALLWTMIRFFRLTANIEMQQLADWPLALTKAGLIRTKQAEAVGGMVSTGIWIRPTNQPLVGD